MDIYAILVDMQSRLGDSDDVDIVIRHALDSN